VSGGETILEEMSYQENANGGFYSGYDVLPVGATDQITAAEYAWKQVAVPVTISGLEELKNAGRERMIGLLSARIRVAEATMSNIISGSLYSDGTGTGGKEIDGLDAAVPLDPTSGTYGGIDRATWTFWRNKFSDSANTTTLLADMNGLYASLCRGQDKPNLIMMDNTVWEEYTALLQAQQRFATPGKGEAGFDTLKFMGADCVLDGGIGGFCPAGTAFFLNTNYIHYRPHSARNMVPIAPNKRSPVNQDATVQILGWAGNMTCSGAQFQGRLDVNA